MTANHTYPSATRAEIHARLEAERRELSEAIANGPPEGADTEVAGSLLASTRQRVAELDAALARLDEGTYGRCSTCGQPIAEARLEALPATASCVECVASYVPPAFG